MMGTLGVEATAHPTFLDPKFDEEVPIPLVDHGNPAAYDANTDPLGEAEIASVCAILDAAVERARQEVERFSLSARAHTNLGLALLNRGRLEAAEAEFERALELDPRYRFATVNLGRVRIWQDRLEDAERLFADLRVAHSTDLDPIMGLAAVAVRRKDLAQATRLLERAVELKPGAVLPRFHLGMALLGLGRAKEAISRLREASSSNPRAAELHLALGAAYAQAGDPKRAIQSFKATLSLVPGTSEAIYGLAHVLVDNGDAAQAVALLNGLLEHHPADREARELLAWAHFRSQEYKRARNELNRIIAMIDRADPEAMADQARLLNNLGTCFWLLGNRDDAARQLARSIKLKPDAPTPYHNLSRLLLDNGRLTDAIAVLEQCEEHFPRDTTSRLLHAVALDRLDRQDEAIDRLRSWVDTGEAPADAWGLLGYYLTDRKRQPDAAVKVLSEGRVRLPSDPLVANNLAYAYLMQGNPTAARAVLESLPEGLKKASSGVAVVLNATWGLLRLWEGDFDAADRGYQRAEEIALQRGDYHLAAAARRKKHLEFARAFRWAGNVEGARREVQQGLAVSGEDSYGYGRELKALAAQLRRIGAN